MADAVVAPIGSETVRPPLTGDNSTGGLQEVAAKVSGEVLPAQFKMETTVTEGGKTVVPVEQNRSRLDVERSADVLEKQAGSRIENSLRQGVEVPRTQTQAVKSVNPKAFTDVSVKAPAPSAPVQKGTPLVVGTENMVLQLDTPEKNGSVAQRSMSLPEAQSTQMPRPVETQVAAQVVTPVQLQAAKQTASQVDVEAVKHVVEQSVSLAADLADVSVPQPEQAIQQKVRTSTHLVPLAAAPVTEVLPENNPVRINPRDASKILNVEKVDPVTNIVAVATDEKNFGSDGERPNQSANSNVLSNTMHQQVKTEGLAAVGTVAGTDTNNSSRSSQPAEQVVQQVRERLVNHVTKPGSEQIVLRLSPEHLGDLRVNLNLEGQRLKVEIVAENSTVRDSLLQNTDLLKESLSRQNIKMESFDVTTGGNGTADNSRGQGEWRELAQRRQQNLWMPEGGYRTAKQAAPAVAAYQQKSQHTMLDVHF
jgi:flagellar hook-length control protein FliK